MRVNRLHVALGHRRYDLVLNYIDAVEGCVCTQIRFSDGRSSSCASLFCFKDDCKDLAVKVARRTCFKCSCIHYVHLMLATWFNKGWTEVLKVVAYEKHFKETKPYYVGYAWRFIRTCPPFPLFYDIYPEPLFVLCHIPLARRNYSNRRKTVYCAWLAYKHRFSCMFREDTLQGLALKHLCMSNGNDDDTVKRILLISRFKAILK
ncbi:hypothetical protein ECIV_ORF56 [European chub iridovirus]|nr:hypothetical protein ECIV_ORF56 [European chub iridovirus]